MYILQIFGEQSNEFKDQILETQLIDLSFDILKELGSKDSLADDEYGDIEETMTMTFSKLTQNYFTGYQKVRKVLKFMVN